MPAHKENIMQTLRIGSGAGYSGDRIEPALELAEKGGIQYLVFECLAERTIALAQQAKLKDPSQGFDPLLVDRMEAVLSVCREKGIRIITNMGAANPVAGAARIAEVARSLGIHELKIAAVTGDDVLAPLKASDYPIMETGAPVSSLERVVSANAYLGAAPIVEALRNGADIVIPGRVADPALFLAPLIHEFGWAMDDWNLLGKGTVIGHLLECAGQITGGYFADPGIKDVPDPARHLTPDVVADFSSVTITEIGPDRVLIEGGGGRPRTDTLKVSVGYVEGYTGEGQISYAGPGAVNRGRLALEIVRERLKLTGVRTSELRFDLIGLDSIHGSALSAGHSDPYEVRVRVAGRTDSIKEATRIGNEVETLYTNGPAGGGGATKSVREVMAVASVLLPRGAAIPEIHYVGA